MNQPWNHWSVSQVSMFRACQRKWWWAYIRGFKEPTTEAQAAGTAHHAQMEKYLKGEPVQLSRAEAASVPFLPKPGTFGMQVELPIHGMEVDGIPIRGFIDVCGWLDAPPWVIDHKTSSDAAKWAKLPDQLLTDPQMVVYAEAVTRLAGRPYAPVKVGHVTTDLKRALAIPSFAVLAPVPRRQAYAEIEDTVRAMKALATVTDVHSVPPTWTACSAYKGCPHQDRCEAARKQSQHLKETPMSTAATPSAADMAAQIRRRAAAAVNPSDAARPAAAAAPAAAPAAVAAAVQGAAAASAGVVAGYRGYQRKPRGWEDKLKAQGWTDAQLSKMHMNSVVDAMLDGLNGADYAVMNDGRLEKPTPVAPAETPAVALTDAQIDDLANKGYPEDFLNAATDALLGQLHAAGITWEKVESCTRDGNKIVGVVLVTPPAPTPDPTPAPTPSAAPAAAPAETPVGEGPYMLYLGCGPISGVQAVLLEDWLARTGIEAAVCEANKVPSIYSIPFGEGNKQVAAHVSVCPDGALPRFLRIMGESSLDNAVRSVLLPRYPIVVSR